MSRTIAQALFALGALSLLACGPAEPPEPEAPAPEPSSEPEPEAEAEPEAPAKGEYTCRLTLAGEEQPETTCVIEEGDLPDTLWLDIREGELLVSGEVIPVDADTFELAGDLFCPQGTCDEAIEAEFYRAEAGVYEARVDTSQGELVIELLR